MSEHQSPDDHDFTAGKVDLPEPIHAEAVELNLKDKTEAELSESLLRFGANWEPQQRQMVIDTIHLVSRLHAGDSYKGQPYVMHLLRAANRVAGYLELPDPELVMAALLHDSVEDHAQDLLLDTMPQQEVAAMSEVEWQEAALALYAERFSPRTADAVRAVTNPPDMSDGLTKAEWMDKYEQKIVSAVITVEGWIVKFADWCDNGLGIKYSEAAISEAKKEEWRNKYGRALPHFEARFKQPDIQALLSDNAKAYVEQQLRYGRERLNAPTT